VARAATRVVRDGRAAVNSFGGLLIETTRASAPLRLLVGLTSLGFVAVVALLFEGNPFHEEPPAVASVVFGDDSPTSLAALERFARSESESVSSWSVSGSELEHGHISMALPFGDIDSRVETAGASSQPVPLVPSTLIQPTHKASSATISTPDEHPDEHPDNETRRRQRFRTTTTTRPAFGHRPWSGTSGDGHGSASPSPGTTIDSHGSWSPTHDTDH